jgi:hypothetical protein
MDLSPGWLLASLCVGSIGTGLFVYGKKQVRLPQFLAGVFLILESAFVSSVPWMFTLAALILTALWGCVRAGL